MSATGQQLEPLPIDAIMADVWIDRLERVQRAIDAAGLPRGVEADIYYQNGRPIGILIAGDWNRPRKRKAKHDRHQRSCGSC